MDSIRCGNCSFLNFASASVCKRCKAEFEIAPAAFGSSTFADYTAAVSQANYQPMPQWNQPSYQQAYQPPPYFSAPIAPLPRTSKNGATNAMLWTLLGIAFVIALGIGILWKFGKTAPVNYAWQEYTPQDASYTVQMPARPVESVQEVPSPAASLQMHGSLANMSQQEAYLTAYIDYPDNFKNYSSDALLDGAAQGGLTNSHSTLVSKKRITLDGYPGVEIEMIMPAGEVPGGGRAISRIYWVAPRIYITVGGGPDTQEVRQAVVKFLASFKLKKR
jgi:hypothetical protein